MTKQPKTLEQFTEVVDSLQERVKELSCLYDILRLIEKNESQLDRIGQGVVDLLPKSWQFPTIACARFTIDNQIYETANFQSTDWRQVAEIRNSQRTIGEVEVCYLEQRPDSFEGPFLREERQLIDAIATHLGRASTRIDLERQNRERIKELTCLYRVSQVIEQHGENLSEIFQEIADLLPGSWQFPDIASGRVAYGPKQFVSLGFATSPENQSAEIVIGDKTVGVVEVHYREHRPEIDEGPFLHEERMLINAIAERLGRVIDRILTQQQLSVERQSLHNMNITLREVLSRIESEKNEISSRIQLNVDKVIMPTLTAIEQGLPAGMAGYAKLLKDNLGEIVSPFTKQIIMVNKNLTPAEIQICNMIRSGLSTKEIADTRSISPATVSVHREHIRRKLGIRNQKVNLASHLMALAE